MTDESDDWVADGAGQGQESDADAWNEELDGGELGATDGPAVDEPVDDPTEIATSELTVDRRSLHPRVRIVWAVRAVLTALIVGAIAYAVDEFWLGAGLVVPGAVTALFLGLGVPHALLRYRVWSYEVREDALYLERGVVTRVRTVVPLVRIQHVDTSRGPIERTTGLATCVVYTAGSRGADVAIPGLEADRADDLQQRLKRLAIASEADTSV